ncbi:hypothetical protein NUU61_001587 [Penicillium alfredii]|uniref:RNase III domain-containing protein n=1 Tax=Penicillium alfredii TaxID=1506179 RepID=A0A9W9G2B0_9EURO|nr:uncharacterized protein NUU61_001587 [Penicillium alfredii]KAJ5110330.1 hypothetical protein NUU61_001587 [Penicillium alfredii]
MNASAIERVRTLFGIPDVPADLIQEAITVAGASPKYPDGFKNLSQLGVTSINACVQELGIKTSSTREVISDVMTNYNTMEYRAVVARRNGIQDLIEYGNNGRKTERNLAFAITALVATVFLTQERDFFRKSVIKLGFLDEGSGLQLRQKYEAVMRERSVPRPTSPPSVTAASVQDRTTMDEQSLLPPFRQSSEASFSEDTRLPAATSEASLTSECSSFVPFNLSTEIDSLDIVHCSATQSGNSQVITQATDPAQWMDLFDSELCQVFEGPRSMNEMSPPAENCAFSLQATALREPIIYQDTCAVNVNAAIALVEEQMSTAALSGTTRKRKSVNDNNAQKPKRANTVITARWVSSLTEEMERCQLKDSFLPPSVFFREEIELQCSKLDGRWNEMLTSILVQIADSNSFACLREAVCASKSMGSNNARKISTDTSVADRLHILEKLNGENVYNCFLARYHTLELFRDCGGNEGTEDLRIIPYAADKMVTHSGRRGNPTRIALAEVTDRMMTREFPSLASNTVEYKRKRAAMKRHRLLASRFQTFVDAFGPAILCFIQPFNGQIASNGGISDNKIREINETSLKAFVDILNRSQGDYLREVCQAAEPLLQYLVYEDSTITEFAIERTDVDILQLPKGSKGLLRLLKGTSGNGEIDEIY